MSRITITYSVDEAIKYLKNHEFKVVGSVEPSDCADGGVTVEIGDRQIEIQIGEGYLIVSEWVDGKTVSHAPDVHLFDGVLRQLYRIKEHNATIKELWS